MNAMDELRNAKPVYLETPTPETTRLRELNYAMAQQRTSTVQKKKFRPALGLGVIGAVAAGTAAAALVLSGGGAEPVKAPTVAAPQKTISEQPVKLSGHEVLLVAAKNSEKQARTSGKWWHSSVTSSYISEVQGGGYRIFERQKSDTWTPSATRSDSWNTSQKLAFGFPTKADEQAWQAAGSPATVTVEPPRSKKGAPGLGGYQVQHSDGKVKTEHSPIFQGDKVFWLGRNVTMADLKNLPADPKALKANLLKWYGGHDTESDSAPMSSDAWLYRVSTGLIAEMPVTPQVRGAAFRMLADLKSVKVTPDVRTADGRTGTAVSIEEISKVKMNAKGSGLNENRLVFDIATGTALQTDSVVVKPGQGNQAGLAPGTVWTMSTITSAGWTDTDPS